jgi:predicted transport protein
MDQGQTYLNLVLDHKADVLLEYLEKTNKPLKKNEVDWSQTRVMFIGPKFNTYQKRALSETLPFELWEVTLYDGGLIEYDEIIPIGLQKKTEKKTIPVLTGTAGNEIKTYTVEDHFKKSDPNLFDIFQKLREQILLLDTQIKEKPVSSYIGYQLKGYLIVWVQVLKDRLFINMAVENPIDPESRLEMGTKSSNSISKIPVRRFIMKSDKDVAYVMRIISQAYEVRKG